MATTNTEKPVATAFAKKLNKLLVENKITRRELARRIESRSDLSFETARTNVHRLLRGDHVPNETTRGLIADCIGVGWEEFEEEALVGAPFRGGPRGGAAGAGRGAKASADTRGDLAA